MPDGLEASMTKPRQETRKKSLRVLQKEETLQLLLKSAAHLFFRKGYASTTIDDIAARAGTSRATFYLHFPRKWSILQKIVEETILAESLEFYRRLDKMDVPSREELRTWLIDAMGYFERHKQILSVYRQAKSIEPEIEHLNMQFLRRCVDVMPNYLARWGPDREAYAKLRLNMLTIQLDDAASWIIHDTPEVDMNLVVDALLEYWMVGLRSPE